VESNDYDDDDVDDVVVFKPAFARNDYNMSPSMPIDPEPYLPFATKNYDIFKSNGKLYEIYGSSNFYEVRQDLQFVRDNMDRFLRQQNWI
jgi:hypothetical protein